jgi:hypothetical protein
MTDKILQVAISCRDNPECVFNRDDILLDIVVTNTADHDIGLPLAYLRRKGIYCLIFDKRTNKKMEMGTSLTPLSLQREFVRVSPGQQIKLSHKLGADMIRSIGDRLADFDAVIEISGLLELKKGEEPIDFIEEAKISIQGKTVHSQ